MPDLAPAAELRAASARLREYAAAASVAPWLRSGIGDFGWTVHLGPEQSVETEDSEQGRANADWIALVDPAVGLLLADWLETIAARLDHSTHPDWQDVIEPKALAVARAINTTEEQH